MSGREVKLGVIPEVHVLWNYLTETVVDAGVHVTVGLFDTHRKYTYRHHPQLPWELSCYPGHSMYVQEADVPELVRMAALVAS